MLHENFEHPQFSPASIVSSTILHCPPVSPSKWATQLFSFCSSSDDLAIFSCFDQRIRHGVFSAMKISIHTCTHIKLVLKGFTLRANDFHQVYENTNTKPSSPIDNQRPWIVTDFLVPRYKLHPCHSSSYLKPLVHFNALHELPRSVAIRAAWHGENKAFGYSIGVAIGDNSATEPIALGRWRSQRSNLIHDTDSGGCCRWSASLLNQSTTSALNNWSEWLFQPRLFNDFWGWCPVNDGVDVVRNLQVPIYIAVLYIEDLAERGGKGTIHPVDCTGHSPVAGLSEASFRLTHILFPRKGSPEWWSGCPRLSSSGSCHKIHQLWGPVGIWLDSHPVESARGSFWGQVLERASLRWEHWYCTGFRLQ